MTPERIREIRETGTQKYWSKNSLREFIGDLLRHIDTLTAELADARRKAVGECITVCEAKRQECDEEEEAKIYQLEYRRQLRAESVGWTRAIDALRALLDKPAPETAVCVWRWGIGWLHADCDPCTPTTHPETGDKCPKCGKPIKIDAPEKGGACPEK